MANEQRLGHHHWRTNIAILLGGIFLITTIIFAVLYGVQRSKTSTTTVNDDLCLTPYCIKAANYLLESIDEDVKPCENFFEFACGTWLKKNRIPDDAGSQDTFRNLGTELDKNIVDILTSSLPNDTTDIQAIANARGLYNSCVNEAAIDTDGIDPVLSFINELGGWPILKGSTWDNSTFNLSRLLIKLREYNLNVLYNVGTSTDDRNSSAYYIRVSQSDLGLGQRSYYINETKDTMAYRQFIHDLAESLTNDTTAIASDVENIFQFEKRISTFHWTSDEQRARQNDTVRTTFGNLSQIFNTNFNFPNYLQQLYLLSNVSLNNNDIISISELDFLRNVSAILDQSPSRTIQNYFIWRFLMNTATHMPSRYRSIKDRFIRVSQGTSAERPRSTICGSFVNANMGFAVSKIYINKYFDENARNQSLEMINNIRNAFIDMIEKSTWMDDSSKSEAVNKALAIDEKIGYPEYLGSTNKTELERIYNGYNFNSSYISNLIKLLQIKSKENLRVLREPVDRKAWGTTPPTIVNAFYAASRNQIIFPAGILQTPFFHKDAPKYLNYGGIGAVIGHEITHGFDDNGRQYDKDGNRIPWWSAETIEKFNLRKKCIVDQYGNYTLEQIGLKLNGNQTQGENIADNGGVKEAFYAYQKWTRTSGNLDRRLPGLMRYSAEQMFFINYGQVWCSKMTDANAKTRVLSGVHSPGQFRVIGPTSNFDEFDRVFSCKPGQGNSRVDKCTVW